MDDELTVLLDKTLASAVLADDALPSLRKAPGIRGIGLEPAEVLIVGIGLTADLTGLILARSQIAHLARRLWYHTKSLSDAPEFILKYRNGKKSVSITVRGTSDVDLADSIRDLMESIET